MMKYALSLLALLLPSIAMAQSVPIPPGYGSQQTLTCTNASTSLNFSTWPAPQGFVEITPSSSGQTYVYVCALGGTCSATTGRPLVIAQDWTIAVSPTVKPTCITDGAASVNIIGRE